MKNFKDFKNTPQVDEGPNDPAIFKAIFLAGGPGAGKSFIVGKTGLPILGFKPVNSDTAFENAMKKAGMEMNPDNIFSTTGQVMRNKATEITAKIKERYIKGRLGLVIDGTGKDYDKVKGQMLELKAIGYDVAMIFVNTDLDTALTRNRNRARTLPEPAVVKMWKGSNQNIGRYQSLFKNKFIVVDNSDGVDWQRATEKGFKFAQKFANEPIENAQAKKWINDYRNGVLEGTLAAADSQIVDALLNKIREKLTKDIASDNYKDINDIAKLVRKSVERDTKRKGHSRLKDK